MAINITMPALSPTMEEGKLAKWLVKEGDDVASGDIIAEIETDKATMEVEAVDEGKIAKILVEAGAEGVKVNSVIAVLAEDGEDISSVEVSEESSPKSEASEAKSEAPSAPTPAAAQPKEEAPKPVPSAGSGADRIKASPLARRIAAQKGIDLKSLKGSGPHGRIIKKDVEAAASAPKPAAATTASAGSPDGLILPQVLDDRIYDPESYELVPLELKNNERK